MSIFADMAADVFAELAPEHGSESATYAPAARTTTAGTVQVIVHQDVEFDPESGLPTSEDRWVISLLRSEFAGEPRRGDTVTVAGGDYPGAYSVVGIAADGRIGIRYRVMCRRG